MYHSFIHSFIHSLNLTPSFMDNEVIDYYHLIDYVHTRSLLEKKTVIVELGDSHLDFFHFSAK